MPILHQLLKNVCNKINTVKQLNKVYDLNNLIERHYVQRAEGKKFISNEYHLDLVHIEEAIKTNPSLAGISEDFWKRSHATFANHGINTTSFLRIVCGNPAILRRPTQRIINSFEQWRGCQFGEDNVHLLITKYPEMLDVDETQSLHNHIAFLAGLVLTHKNVWKLLMNSPDVMSQNQATITAKMNYMLKDMGLDVPEIIKSCALSKSLDEIRTRHVFQLRLGIFKPRSPKANPLEQSTNDKLYKITDTSEKTFATKICHVSLDEYETFKQLFQRELNREEGVSEDIASDDEI